MRAKGQGKRQGVQHGGAPAPRRQARRRGSGGGRGADVPVWTVAGYRCPAGDLLRARQRWGGALHPRGLGQRATGLLWPSGLWPAASPVYTTSTVLRSARSGVGAALAGGRGTAPRANSKECTGGKGELRPGGEVRFGEVEDERVGPRQGGDGQGGVGPRQGGCWVHPGTGHDVLRDRQTDAYDLRTTTTGCTLDQDLRNCGWRVQTWLKTHWDLRNCGWTRNEHRGHLPISNNGRTAGRRTGSLGTCGCKGGAGAAVRRTSRWRCGPSTG